jgi:dolichol-phosphate mannosyltransferase
MLHWIKFNVVGVLGFALQSGALFVLTHTAYRISYLAATALAVELAVLNNFIWHQRWTWNDRPAATKKETLRRLAKFNVTTGLVSIAGNLLLMNLLVGHFGLQIAGANLVSVAACSLLNFILADRIAFDVEATSTSEPEAVATGPMLNSE